MTVLAVAGPSPLWYLTRGTGLVAMILLTLTVALGVANSGRWTLPGWPRFATAGLHRNVSLLVVVLLGIHIATAELDTFAPVGLAAVVVPFASAYRPIWLGLGTLAFDLLLALVVTSLARHRIGQRTWRAIHWAAYASWPLALVHGLGTGTDPRTPVMQAVAVACVGLFLAAVAWRLGRPGSVAPGRRLLAAGGVVAAVLVVASWARGGPLRSGWSRRAGTPAALIASSRPKVPVTVPANPANPAAPAPDAGQAWNAALAGRLRQEGPDASGTVTVTIAARMSGGRVGTLNVILVGLAADGGVSLRHSSVSLDVTGGRRWSGQLVALDGEQMAATVTDSVGHVLSLAIDLSIDPTTGAVTGQVTATPAASANGS